MVEPGAAVAAFAMSVVSWYGMVRNGYATAYFDFHDIRQVGTDRVSIKARFEEQGRRFGDFQRFWLITNDKLPGELYNKLWGTDISQTIQDLLKNVKDRSEGIDKRVKSWNSSKKPGPDSSKKNFFSRLQPKKAASAAKFVAAERQYLERCLGSFATDIASLEDAAKRGYQRAQKLTGNLADLKEEDVHNLIIGYLLVRLADRWRDDVISFAGSLAQASPDFFVELELNEISGTAPSQRRGDAAKVAQATAVAQTAAAGRLKLSTLAGRRERQHLNPTRVSVEAFEASDSMFHSDSHAAFQILLPNGSLQAAASCDYRVNASTHIRIAKASIVHLANVGHRLPLRRFSSQPTPPAFFSCTTPENELEKYRAVFELAQTYLIFLRTDWLQSLCSCHLHFGQISNPSEHEFSLSVADDQHIPHPSTDAQPWCAHPNGLDRNLCLGILLAEITLGVHVIPNANNPFGVRRVYLVAADQRGNLGDPLNFEQLGRRLRGDENPDRRIRRTTDYADAIMYCFRNPAPSPAAAGAAGQVQPTLEEFYSKVVVKLRDYYFTIEEQIRRNNQLHNMLAN